MRLWTTPPKAVGRCGDHPPHARDTRQTRCRQSPLPRPSPRLRLRPATSPRAAPPARSPPGASRARPVRFGLSPGSVHEARGTAPRPPAPISIPDAASATRAITDMRTKRSDRRSRVPAPPARASSSPPRAPRPPQPRIFFCLKSPTPAFFVSSRPVAPKRGVSLVVQAKETIDRTTGFIGKDNSGSGNIFAIEPRQLYTESPPRTSTPRSASVASPA